MWVKGENSCLLLGLLGPSQRSLVWKDERNIKEYGKQLPIHPIRFIERALLLVTLFYNVAVTAERRQ